MIQKNNRREILEAAYWLFYDKGYDATSLEDIARKCGVTKQAVTYHFGSKGGLGKEVATLMSTRTHAHFEKLIKQYKPDVTAEQLSAAYLIWFSQVYRNDAKRFRFFREYILIDENFSELVAYAQPTYEQELAPKTADMMEAIRQMQMTSAFYAGKGLLYNYALGNLNCSEELFAQYYFSNYYIMFYSERELKQMYQEGKAVLAAIGMEKLPYRMDLFL